MSSSNGSGHSTKKHLVVGTAGLSVGTLRVGVLTKIARLWPTDQLTGKKEAGIPDGFGYVHFVTGIPTALATALRHKAKEMKEPAQVFEPADEEIVEARLRPFLGLPAIPLPTVSSILNPVGYFKAEMAAAIALASEALTGRDKAVAALEVECRAHAELLARFEPLAGRDSRRYAVIRRLGQRLRNTVLALKMSSGREVVEMPPAQFAREWQENLVALSEAQARIRESVGAQDEPRGRKPREGGALAATRARVRDLEAANTDLETQLTERAATIRGLHDRLDAQETRLSAAVVPVAPSRAPEKAPAAKASTKAPRIKTCKKLADLADELLKKGMLDMENLSKYAALQGFRYKDAAAVMKYAHARRELHLREGH